MALKNQLTTADYLPITEFKKLCYGLRADKNYMYEMYARISFYTALRSSDVLSLTWSDVLNRSYIVRTEKKTKKTRQITMSSETQKHILELYTLMGEPNPSQLIFYSQRCKGALTIQAVNKSLKTFKDRYDLDIEHFSTHSFRKAFGRYIYDTSKDKTEALLLLNKILNHTSTEITKAYIGIRQDEINAVFDSINF